MNYRDYKVTSPSFKGAIYFRFINEGLTHVEFDVASGTLSYDQWQWICKNLPANVSQMKQFSGNSFDVKELKPKSVKDKVIQFCSAYKYYLNVAYRATTLEKANVKNVPINKELLKVFFESPLQNFTLKNYTDRINITKAMAKNGMKGRQYPAYYDKDLDRQLSEIDRKDYYAHLQKMGWEKDYNPVRGTTWKQKSLFQ